MVDSAPARSNERRAPAEVDRRRLRNLRSYRFWLRLVLAIGAVLLLSLAGRRLAGLVPAFTDWVRSLGPLGPIAFIAGYALATVAFVPGSLLTLVAGAVFGVGLGTLYVLVGATLGASGAFGISRHVARSALQRRMAGLPRFAAIDRAVSREGLKVVLLLRLTPVVPFNVLNYALGLTQVRFIDFVVASAGMLPATLLYTYSGRLVGDVSVLVAGRSAPRTPGYYVVLGLGLAATVAVTTMITRAARRALRDATGEATS